MVKALSILAKLGRPLLAGGVAGAVVEKGVELTNNSGGAVALGGEECWIDWLQLLAIIIGAVLTFLTGRGKK